jgi:predicted nucleotidyltransferase
MVRLVGDSPETDASLRALADAVSVASKQPPWLVVGGYMVVLHALRAGLDRPPRVMPDADIAVNLQGWRMRRFIKNLRKLGYDNPRFSNRFQRDVGGAVASIDIVIPSFSTKHQPNIDVGVIAIDGMPFVDIALNGKPVALAVTLDLSTGEQVVLEARIPDVVTAIAIKTFAIAERSNPKDARDIATLLLVVDAEGAAGRWESGPAFTTAARQLHAQFDTPGGALAEATDSPEMRERLRKITRELLAEHARASTTVF